MAGIQASTGLVTGVPIIDTVDQLVAISARPRDLLIQRTEQLAAQQVAVSELTAQVIGIEFAAKQLGSETLYTKRDVTSSDDSLLSVTATGDPAVATHRFTPVRKAQTHQLLSGGFSSATDPLGEGQMTLGFGGYVDEGIALDELNAGAGVQRGEIRITDRSGASAIIDLRFALTIDDVITGINANNDVNVTASADGDRIRLVDGTGQSVSNLKVQEVGLGSTAADLGLAGIDAAADEAVGQDVLRLYEGLSLTQLNDGNGVAFRSGAADLEVTFRDGSAALQIEFHGIAKGPTTSSAATDAANGIDAQVEFTSVGQGEAYDGYRISFVDDETIFAGNETVTLDAVSKSITFHIDAGNTRAYQIVDALNNDETASQYFTAAAASGGSSNGIIDVSDTATTSGGATEYKQEKTLGEVVETINAADPTRLRAQISAAGDHIELIDLTTGGGTFSVTSLFGGGVAESLGLTTSAVDGVITGERRFSGLQTVLLDSLAGGYGLGDLGMLSLTDRSGGSDTVDLSTAETLSDAVQAINSTAVGITARVNSARNGILLSDTTGATGNLVVSSADATGTAEKLRIAVDDVVASVNSGSLDLRTFHGGLLLDDLNGGKGVGKGSFLITDSDGQVGAVNLATAGAKTVGDVLELINGLGIGVEARINDTGDGILLVDTASGSGTMSVTDSGTGTAAADLKIAGTATTVDIGGTPTQVLDGTTSIRITLDADDTLQDLVEQINEQHAGISASLLNTGTGTTPYRLSLTSQISGREGALLIDGSDLNVRFDEVIRAQDALLLVGAADDLGAGALAASSSNTFDSLIDGLTLTVNGSSAAEVTVTVEQTEGPIVTQLQLLTDQYNRVRDKLDELTFFDENENTTGLLFGSLETLRVEMDLSNLLTSRYAGLGSIQSLAELGLSLNDQGRLEFDEGKLRAKYAESPEDVERFFTESELGISDRLVRVAKQLSGEDNSLLMNRVAALQNTIDLNAQRIEEMNVSLESEREKLLQQFYNMELIISRLRNNQTALDQLQPIPPLVSTR